MGGAEGCTTRNQLRHQLQPIVGFKFKWDWPAVTCRGQHCVELSFQGSVILQFFLLTPPGVVIAGLCTAMEPA